MSSFYLERYKNVTGIVQADICDLAKPRDKHLIIFVTKYEKLHKKFI
jgi:hypothetical protein